MKMKFQPQYVLSLGASAVLVYVLLLVPSSVYAANLNWSADTRVELSDGSILTIKSGSTATSFSINATNPVSTQGAVTITAGESFTLEHASRHIASSFSALMTTCTNGVATQTINTAGSYTFGTTSLPPSCSGGGLPPPSTSTTASTPPAETKKPVETVKPAESTKQPGEVVLPPAEEEPAVVVKPIAAVKKELNALKAEMNKDKKTRNRKIAVAGNEKFALLVNDLNRGLAAANVEGELKEDLVAKPNDVLTLAKRLESLVKAQATLARAEEKVENPGAAVTAAEDALRNKLEAFFEDGKLVKKEVREAKKLLKSAKIKVKGGISVKNQERIFSSVESGLAKQHAAKVKAETKKAPKELKKAKKVATKLLKAVQFSIKKLNKTK